MMDVMCGKCGFAIKPDDEIVVYGVRKHRDCFGAMIDRLQAAEAEAAALRAQLAAIGDGWEVPDGVEFPVGRVEVLVVRPAIWRDCVEEWEDTRTDYYLSGVIAYRDAQPPQE